MKEAACQGMAPRRSEGVKLSGDDIVPEEMDIFFPYRGQNKTPGKVVCSGCTVRKDCLEWSERTGSKVGMWAGEMKQKGKQ